MFTLRFTAYSPDDNDEPARNIYAPLTRMERIMSGEDLEPLTREEYFMKQLVASISTTANTAAAAILPTYAVADDGKVLKVDTEGEGASAKAILVWATDAT
jgi:hypothetical protein